MSKRIINLVVLISGGGTNLQSIIDCISAGEVDAKISAVISDREKAYGLVRAQKANIPGIVVKPDNYTSRIDYESALANVIADYGPDLVVLAGFMRILGENFVEKFVGKMINIHPSLLPRFKGLDTHQRAIDAGEKIHGATVHFVTTELDAGPAIIQAQVDIESEDTAATLQQKVLFQEHLIYPRAIQWIAEGKVQFE